MAWLVDRSDRGSYKPHTKRVGARVDLSSTGRLHFRDGFWCWHRYHPCQCACHSRIRCGYRSAVMVRQAKQRNAAAIEAKQVELHCGCALSIPYPDAMFDEIFSINVVQFWTNPLAELAELKRVLKSGGSIALAIQPRIPNASEATSQATGKFLLKLLNEAGFDRIELKSKLMKPVSIVCVLGIKKSA